MLKCVRRFFLICLDRIPIMEMKRMLIKVQANGCVVIIEE